MTTKLSIHATHQGGLRVLAGNGTHEVLTDYALPGGEPAAGLTSLELLLASLATCSANGVAALLKRDGLHPEVLEVTASGQRRETHPTVLAAIHLAFEVAGPGLREDVVERALELAEKRLCPVWVMLAAGTPITRSLNVHCGAPHEHVRPALHGH